MEGWAILRSDARWYMGAVGTGHWWGKDPAVYTDEAAAVKQADDLNLSMDKTGVGKTCEVVPVRDDD